MIDYIIYSSSSLLGKVEATKKAISPLKLINKTGNGSSSSATIGESIVNDLAIKLHIPVAVALFSWGKTTGLLNEAWYVH